MTTRNDMKSEAVNIDVPADVETHLRDATSWSGGPTHLWKAALDSTQHTRGANRRGPLGVGWRARPRLAMAAMLAIAAGAALTTVVASRSRSGDSAEYTTAMLVPRQVDTGGPVAARSVNRTDWADRSWQPGPDDRGLSGGGGGGFAVFKDGVAGADRSATPTFDDATNATSDGLPPGEPVDGRAVVRKASMDLAATDVRSTFIKATTVVSEARGEYVEESHLSGEGDDASGTMKLRVRSDRLDAVLAQIRELGVVVGEQVTGDDVTSQVVDLDARVRNERRIEQELMALLDQRKGAPLKDVLEVRDHLSRIRGSIERLIAEQQRLGRLVSLSTIVVVIHPPPKSDPLPSNAAQSSMRDYFGSTMHAAWNGAIRSLTDALGFIVEVVVGGLPWWCLAVVLALAARSMWRRRIAAGVV